MTLKMWKRDMTADVGILTGDARQFTSDVRHLATDTIKDAKAEAAHLADPAQHESIIERHVGFLAGVMYVFLAAYFGVIAWILSLPAPH